jgi:hydrogenase-4 membrane subunit HyfE
MDWNYILNFIYEIAYFLATFALFFTYAIFKGRQAVMNVIIGLYLALLISIEFPYYDKFLTGLDTSSSIAGAKLIIFLVMTALTTTLCFRIMPDEFRENRFESIWRKLLLSLGATILIMTFSFNVLPVTEFLAPGTPIQSLFAPESYFFWWLLAPLVFLYIV